MDRPTKPVQEWTREEYLQGLRDALERREREQAEVATRRDREASGRPGDP